MKRSVIILFLLLFVCLSVVNFAAAAICDPKPGDPQSLLCNPTGAADISTFIGFILTAVGLIIGVITIAMVVYSGFRMVLSSGNEEQLTQAKSSFKWSLIGFLITVFAFVIVYGVGRFFGLYDVLPDPEGSTEVFSIIPYTDFDSLLEALIYGALTTIGLLALLFIIINGFRYITARGNEEQVEKAKQGIWWSVIGLIIVLLAYVIVSAINQLTS